MQKMRANSVDMLNGPLLPSIWVFSLPLMLTNLRRCCFRRQIPSSSDALPDSRHWLLLEQPGSLCFLLIALSMG